MPSWPSMPGGASSRLKDTPRRAAQTPRQWTERLRGWKRSSPRSLFCAIFPTKIQQFAAEAAALDVGDIRDILYGPRRWSLLLCFLHHAQVQTRDQLVEMVLKRVRHMTNAAKERLKELHEQHRELEEQMLAVFSEVLDHTIDIPEDEEATLGHSVRQLLQTHGGAEALRDQYEQVSAYHSDNYRPFCGAFIARTARNSSGCPTCSFHSATHDHSLLDALRFVLLPTRPWRLCPRGDCPRLCQRPLASPHQIRHKMTPMLHRRHLEVCVFHYLDHGCAVAMCMWKARRPTPITANSCCHGRRVSHASQPIARRCSSPPPPRSSSPRCASACGRWPSGWMRRTANTALTIDEDGTSSQTAPGATGARRLPTLEALLKARLPERHLLDILKNVHYWVGYTRHFGPLWDRAQAVFSGLRYIFTVFGYACELGASQTARHTTDRLAGRSCDGSMRSTLRPPNWRQPCAM